MQHRHHGHGHHGHGHHGHGHDEERWASLFERQRTRAHLIEGWLDALALRPGQVVADVGAGPGLASLAAARRVGPGGRVYAVDTEAGALAFLQERWREATGGGEPLAPVHTVVADAAEVTLPEPVDALLLTHMLHHAPAPLDILARTRRLVAPTGRAVVAEYDPEGPGERGPELARRIGRATLREWLGQAGWRVVRTVTDQEEQYAWLVVPEGSAS